MRQCKARQFGECVFELRTLKAPDPRTVEDLLARDRAPRDMRGKRIVDICIYCWKERGER